jgi:hypothetical protein
MYGGHLSVSWVLWAYGSRAQMPTTKTYGRMDASFSRSVGIPCDRRTPPAQRGLWDRGSRIHPLTK